MEYDSKLNGVQNIKSGQNLVLTVDFDAVPQPSVEWFHNDSSLSSSDKIDIEYSDCHTTLTVKNCLPEESGKYTLKVKNKAGTSTAQFDVLVRGKPAPPRELEVTKFDKDYVVLAWQPSSDDGGDKIKSYVVEKRDITRPNWVTVGNVKPDKTGIKVDHLFEGNQYLFRVAAENSVGVSDFVEIEKPVKAKLPFDEPDAPTKMRVEEVTKNSVVLSWTAPKSDGGSPIKGYVIEQHSPRSQRWTRVNRQPVKDTVFEHTDVSEGDEYEFRVMAINEAGHSEPSEPTTMTKIKNPYEKPGAPGQPQIMNITADSADITWTKPTSDGGSPITNYRIEMRSKGAYRWDICNVQRVTGTKYTVNNLMEETDYEFRVTAENKAGLGPVSATSSSAKYGELFGLVRRDNNNK